MTESKASSMGFRLTPIWDRKNLMEREWRRELKRPRCHEIWTPDRPNQITRYRYLSPYAEIVEVRVV